MLDELHTLAVRDATRRQRVGPYAAIRPVGGQVAGQPDQPSFDDRVRHWLNGLHFVGQARLPIDALIG